MKYIKTTLTLLVAIAFTGCIGDHPARNGEDTEQNSYHVPPVITSKDTATIIRYTGDTQSMDYSANGGAGLIKLDTNIKR